MNKTVYCTIASANYMPQIMALKESLLHHNPGAHFEVLLCEHPAVVRSVAAELDQRFYQPDTIDCPDWRHMAFYYNCMEFNTALKPYFVQRLFADGASKVVYLDPDILIYSSLAPLEALLDEHALVLTPHLCRPLEDDGLHPPIVAFHQVGQFNLGFAAFRRTQAIEEVVRWWANRCREDCISELPAGLFVDQSWADLFVSFIQEAKVLHSEAYNMAYWNVHQRTLRREGSTWVTGDGPLVFFHFSGFTRDNPEQVSKHQNRVRAPAGSPLHALLSSYGELLANSPYRAFESFEYSFNRFSDGALISPELRRLFRALPQVERQLITNPFTERSLLERRRVVVGASGSAPELDRLRSEVERLRHEFSLLRSENARLRGARPEELRYRAVDALNTLVKDRIPGLHSGAKRLVRIANEVRRFAKRGSA